MLAFCFPLRLDTDVYLQVLIAGSIDFYVKCFLVKIRNRMYGCDMVFIDRFYPYGLPDTGRRGITIAFRFGKTCIVLFSVRNGFAVSRVVDIDNEFLFFGR